MADNQPNAETSEPQPLEYVRVPQEIIDTYEKNAGPPRPAAPNPAPPEIIPDNKKAIAVSLSPDVCRTPDKPVPYAVYGTADNDYNYAPNVRSNGEIIKCQNSKFTKTFGDEPAVAGVQSGTVGDVVEPVTSSTIVRANGIPVQRHGDRCTLNNGNAPGEYCYVQSTDVHDAPDATDNHDKAWYEQAWDGAKDAYHWTGDKLSEANQAVWDFDKSHYKVVTRGIAAVGVVGSAVEGAAGLALAGVGGAASATGVGAAPGVPAMLGGFALTANAVDNGQANLRTLWTGEFTPTVLAQASGEVATNLGASPETAQRVETAVGLTQAIGGGVGAAAATLKTGRTALIAGAQGARSTAAPAEIASIEQRLLAHLRTAQQRAALTAKQARDVARNPARFNTHMGTQIDTEFKALVDADPQLSGIVSTTRRFQFGPDVVVNNPVNGQSYWFDVTTAPQWQAHVSKYTSGFGTGVPLIWP